MRVTDSLAITWTRFLEKSASTSQAFYFYDLTSGADDSSTLLSLNMIRGPYIRMEQPDYNITVQKIQGTTGGPIGEVATYNKIIEKSIVGFPTVF